MAMRATVWMAATLLLATPTLAADPAMPPAAAATAGDLSDLVPPGSGNVATEHDGGKTMLLLTNTLGPTDLLAFYVSPLQLRGWRITDEMRVGEGRLVNLVKGSHGEGLLVLQPDHGVTRVMLSLGD